MHEEERIVAGSYFISAEDGGEEEARADDRETLTMLNVCSTENEAIQV